MPIMRYLGRTSQSEKSLWSSWPWDTALVQREMGHQFTLPPLQSAAKNYPYVIQPRGNRNPSPYLSGGAECTLLLSPSQLQLPPSLVACPGPHQLLPHASGHSPTLPKYASGFFQFILSVSQTQHPEEPPQWGNSFNYPYSATQQLLWGVI